MAIPTVDPVEGDERPFWSVMIPTRNPSPRLLEQALGGVLGQDPGPATMQIEIVDDGSTAFDPEAFLQSFGAGRVAWHRRSGASGIGDCWNECVARARGQWVHVLHQDDIVLPGFYDRLREGIERCPEVGAAACHYFVVDGDGHGRFYRSPVASAGILDDWVEHVFVRLLIQTPCVVVRRSVYETLGGFDTRFRYALDWDMWKRIAVAYPMWYEPEPFACYRIHEASTTADLARSGRDVVEIRESIEASRAYLPEAVADDATRRAKVYYTKFAARGAWGLLAAGRAVAALGRLREASRITSPARAAASLAVAAASEAGGPVAPRLRAARRRLAAWRARK